MIEIITMNIAQILKMLRPNWIFLLLQIFYASGSPVSSDGNLLSAIVLFRHGDRAPISLYKNDPYSTQVSTIWPDGLGQLTEVGKQQQFSLGQWLRNRYNGFLPTDYHPEDITVHSSNVDRCLMSAAANLAGLYPPEGAQLWNPSLQWQPIPIHTTPESDDAILAAGKRCQRYDYMYTGIMYSKHFQDIFRENQEVFDYLTLHSGSTISDLSSFTDLWNTLYIEDLHHLTLPEWTHDVFPEKMKALADDSWRSFTYNPVMALMKSGPLIDQIMVQFDNIAYNKTGTPKLLMLSAHDSTIANLLNSLNLYNDQWPEYASTVILELKQSQGLNYINILYKNETYSDEVIELTLDACKYNCELDQFRKIVSPIRVNMIDWEIACSLS